jgi:tetratricopeptide (TPR) repeat protein
MEPEVAEKIKSARQACLDRPMSADAWAEYGMVLDAHKLAVDAIPCYRRAVELRPGEFRSHYFLGVCLATIDPDAAVEPLNRAVELKPDYAPAHVRLADALLQSDDLDGARRHYDRALELDAENAFAHLGAAKVDLITGDAQTAADHLNRAIQASANLKEAYELFATLLRRAGREDDAEDASRRAAAVRYPAAMVDPIRDTIAEYGVSGEWHATRARALQYEGKLAEAIAAYRKAVEIRPSALHHYNLGAALALAQRHEDAIEAYDRAIELRPDYVEVHFNRGVALGLLGRFDEAVKSYERALDIDPNLSDARLNLAATLNAMGRTDEAVIQLTLAAEHMPDSVPAHFNLGMAFRQKGELDKAIDAFTHALDVDPNHIDSLNNLGIVRAQLGQSDEAIELFEKVIALNPARTDAINNLGIAYTAAGRYAEAIDAFDKGHRMLSAHPGMANKLAWLLATAPADDKRDGARAVEIAEALSERFDHGNPEFLDTLAAAYAESGRFDEAVKAVQSAIDILESSGSEDDRIEPYRGRLERYRNDLPYRMPP